MKTVRQPVKKVLKLTFTFTKLVLKTMAVNVAL